MLCPYCAEKIQSAAIVCRYCQRDLAPSKRLIEENETLLTEISKLRAEVTLLSGQIARDYATAQTLERRKAAPAAKLIDELGLYVLAPTALLWLGHLLIIVLWDQPTIVLRFFSIVIPMPFGFAMVWRERRSLASAISTGVAVAMMAIFGMLSTMHIEFHDAIFPTTRNGLTEDLQYFVSIALAFISGALLALVARGNPRFYVSGGLAAVAAKLAGSSKKEPDTGIVFYTMKFLQVITGIVAIATTIGSIYTGILTVMP